MASHESELISALRRLERAGSESSRATAKLRAAAATVAAVVTNACPAALLGKPLPRHYRVVALGKGGRFAPWHYLQTSSTHLTTWGHLLDCTEQQYVHGDFHMPFIEPPSREAVLQFAADVASGWLDEVAAVFEAAGTLDEAAAAGLAAVSAES